MLSINKKTTLFFSFIALSIFIPTRLAGMFQTLYVLGKGGSFLFNHSQSIFGAGAGTAAAYKYWSKVVKPGQEDRLTELNNELKTLEDTSKEMKIKHDSLENQLEINNLKLHGDEENPGLIAEADTLKNSIEQVLKKLNVVEAKKKEIIKQIDGLILKESEHQSIAEELKSNVNEQKAQIVLFQTQVDGLDTQLEKNYEDCNTAIIALETQTVQINENTSALKFEVAGLSNDVDNLWTTKSQENSGHQKEIKKQVVNNSLSMLSEQVNNHAANTLANKLVDHENHWVKNTNDLANKMLTEFNKLNTKVNERCAQFENKLAILENCKNQPKKQLRLSSGKK